MKKNFLLGISLMMLTVSSDSFAQRFVSMGAGSMTWTTKSKEARKLTVSAANHLMNVEREIAYRELTAAVEKDPDFTVALVFLANLSQGEEKKSLAQRAIASAENKTDGEKLLASLVSETVTPEIISASWETLHRMYPNCSMTEHFYVLTRLTPEERFNAAQAYISKYPEVAAMNNMIAYYYLLDKKDNDHAKKYFETYLQLYPDGTNPYDSMGEYYLLTGDVANAEKYYKKALEKYPFNSSSIIALQKIQDSKKKNEEKKN